MCLYANGASRPVGHTIYREKIMTIVAIDGAPSDSGPVDGWPTLYQGAQTGDSPLTARAIPSLAVASSPAWFGQIQTAV
jgi:hypothetical protein